MTDEQRAKLENLVFSPLDPYLSLDTHLRPFLDLIAEIEQAERERCARVVEDYSEDGPMQVGSFLGRLADAIRALS